MELSQSQSERIEELLRLVDELEPADVPEPAAELAALLGQIIEGTEDN
jgi:hypothetical protein